MNKKLLVIVDMQYDFIDGSLGSPEAKEIVPRVAKKIMEWDGDIVYTQDTHSEDYLSTQEGEKLPVEHCIEGTLGHDLDMYIQHALRVYERNEDESRKPKVTCVIKHTFGSMVLPEMIRYENYNTIEIVGLCTDICVVSNALILKATFPEANIVVDEKCCAGTSIDAHNSAINTMKSCQIDIS